MGCENYTQLRVAIVETSTFPQGIVFLRRTLCSKSLHCALAGCGAVYCNRSCLWVCDCRRAGGRAGGVRTYYSQRARSVCVSLSAFFISHFFKTRSSLSTMSQFFVWISSMNRYCTHRPTQISRDKAVEILTILPDGGNLYVFWPINQRCVSPQPAGRQTRLAGGKQADREHRCNATESNENNEWSFAQRWRMAHTNGECGNKCSQWPMTQTLSDSHWMVEHVHDSGIIHSSACSTAVTIDQSTAVAELANRTRVICFFVYLIFPFSRRLYMVYAVQLSLSLLSLQRRLCLCLCPSVCLLAG